MDSCILRSIPEIDATLLMAWGENATIYLQVTVQNNDSSDYEGYIRVYVTEVTSTRGWNDTKGFPHAFTFLDYAINEDILINPGERWERSTIWKGNEHTDGYGNDFGDITQENVMIIAAVYNAEGYLKYNLPPWGRPFTAYYVDEVDSGLWVNFPPFEPDEPIPANGAKGIEPEADLGWIGGDPNLGDSVSYDVYIGTSNPPPLVVTKQSEIFYDIGRLVYNTTYYWQIVARDNHDTSRAGPVWSFTTKPEWIYGDCNRDEKITVSDVVFLINYLFKGGPTPDPLLAGDANCDEQVTVSDVVYLINYLFKSGPQPAC